MAASGRMERRRALLQVEPGSRKGGLRQFSHHPRSAHAGPRGPFRQRAWGEGHSSPGVPCRRPQRLGSVPAGRRAARVRVEQPHTDPRRRVHRRAQDHSYSCNVRRRVRRYESDHLLSAAAIQESGARQRSTHVRQRPFEAVRVQRRARYHADAQAQSVLHLRCGLRYAGVLVERRDMVLRGQPDHRRRGGCACRSHLERCAFLRRGDDFGAGTDQRVRGGLRRRGQGLRVQPGCVARARIGRPCGDRSGTGPQAAWPGRHLRRAVHHPPRQCPERVRGAHQAARRGARVPGAQVRMERQQGAAWSSDRHILRGVRRGIHALHSGFGRDTGPVRRLHGREIRLPGSRVEQESAHRPGIRRQRGRACEHRRPGYGRGDLRPVRPAVRYRVDPARGRAPGGLCRSACARERRPMAGHSQRRRGQPDVPVAGERCRGQLRVRGASEAVGSLDVGLYGLRGHSSGGSDANAGCRHSPSRQGILLGLQEHRADQRRRRLQFAGPQRVPSARRFGHRPPAQAVHGSADSGWCGRAPPGR